MLALHQYLLQLWCGSWVRVQNPSLCCFIVNPVIGWGGYNYRCSERNISFAADVISILNPSVLFYWLTSSPVNHASMIPELSRADIMWLHLRKTSKELWWRVLIHTIDSASSSSNDDFLIITYDFNHRCPVLVPKRFGPTNWLHWQLTVWFCSLFFGMFQ